MLIVHKYILTRDQIIESSMKKYAIICYGHDSNIGDTIQQWALSRLLPRVDYFLSRECVSEAEHWDEDVKLIISGWLCAGRVPKDWPIRTNADALYLGVHLSSEWTRPSTKYPIGCRDLWTMGHCRRWEIASYLSWCVSLTLDYPVAKSSRTDVFFVDSDEELLKHVPDDVRKAATPLSVLHSHPPGVDYARARMEEARDRLELLSTAKLVVTRRLHTLLPCLAMGIPVAYAPPLPTKFNPKRVADYESLTWPVEHFPWGRPQVKTDPSYVKGMSASLRGMLNLFITDRLPSCQSSS